MSLRKILVALLTGSAAGAALACGGDDPPAAVAGDYTVNVTNGADTCSLPNWNQGASFSDIHLKLEQNGSALTGTFQGPLANLFLNTVLGASTFEGSVSGSKVALERQGTTAVGQGSCAFTVTGTVSARVSGDFIEGTITYQPSTNDSPDCTGIAGCSTQQSFNGSRPPQ